MVKVICYHILILYDLHEEDYAARTTMCSDLVELIEMEDLTAISLAMHGGLTI